MVFTSTHLSLTLFLYCLPWHFYQNIQYSMFDLVAVLNVEDGVALVLLLQLRLQQQRHLVHVQQTVTV